VTDHDRAVAFMRAFAERIAERRERTRYGTALFVDSLPRVHWVNTLEVGLGVRASADELATDAGVVQGRAGLAHRRLSISDDLGGDVEAGLLHLGWKVERLLVMPHRGGGRDVDTSGVEQMDPAELEHAWAAGTRATIPDEETVRQLVAAQHRRRIASDVRYYGARADGEVASYCELFSDGETAQIESVMTLEPFRGRGLASAVVTAALRDARAREHSLVFLCADDGDWPKELYAKLGFGVSGRVRSFLLEGVTSAPS
jgi:predicted GNAT family acetyltransferase